ncbi:hypothetical protein SORBI_3008G064200 [Sorghum bicolor]|uniref:Uncharacterized protein n=1 Tax=Sorghum bicolor TaxID=4558 RepID=A0A1B6PBT3_SORBI|nr:hypothetical protein SORBI_3008G064200 [Sorghum bicolor]
MARRSMGGGGGAAGAVSEVASGSVGPEADGQRPRWWSGQRSWWVPRARGHVWPGPRRTPLDPSQSPLPCANTIPAAWRRSPTPTASRVGERRNGAACGGRSHEAEAAVLVTAALGRWRGAARGRSRGCWEEGPPAGVHICRRGGSIPSRRIARVMER